MLRKLINARGFTLIEMLIVLMVIAVLIILLIPNLANRSEEIHGTGCDALISLVQSQADAYHIDHAKHATSIDTLVSAKYITEDQKYCSNNKELEITNGKVSTKK